MKYTTTIYKSLSHPINKNRSDLFYNLISSFGIEISCGNYARRKDLEEFHSLEFCEYLFERNRNLCADDEFGLDYDWFDGIEEYCLSVVGASLQAASDLMSGTKTAIHFDGGRHHAKRDFASGFCVVNDVVLSILKMREKFKRVLYLDLDVHHGDGVEEAFFNSNAVTTCSFHLYEPGFFPGTGSLESVGKGKGEYHSFNIPLKRGISDSNYLSLFNDLVPRIFDFCKPEAIVVTLGVDGLPKDPLGGFNISARAYAKCCKKIQDFNVPTLFLGGGGYNAINASKCWCLCTLGLLGRHEDFDQAIPIPLECSDWELYNPYDDLDVHPIHMEDENSIEYLESIRTSIKNNIEKAYIRDLDSRSREGKQLLSNSSIAPKII